MKRETIMRMLRKRLSLSRLAVKGSFEYEDLCNILGGDNSKEPQFRKNMETDIKQLEYLIDCLKKFNP